MLEKIKKNKSVLLKVVLIIAAILVAIYVYKWIKASLAAKLEQEKVMSAQKGTGENPTLSVQQINTLATEMYSELTELGPKDSTTFVNYFSEIMNDADFLGVVQAFGTKSFGIVFPTNYTLPQAVAAYCDATTITDINSAMAANGVKSQF